MKFIKFLVALFLGSSIFYSCGTQENELGGSNAPKEGKGGRYIGGVFRCNETEFFRNLFPHSIVDAVSHRIASQIYEGLLKFDQSDLSLKNCLAEEYTIDSSGTVYTFKIKKGVYFHDDPCFPNGNGRELKAQDFKYSFTRLCTKGVNNQGFDVFKNILLGANEYYDATEGDKKPDFEVEGIKIIDDYTLQLTLTKPTSVFLYSLARPNTYVFPKEAYEKYGLEIRVKAVGTGPFYLSSVDEDISVILKRNKNYYGKDAYGNKLPLLDALSIQFIKDKKTELFEFKKGNLDMMYRLPTEYIIEILEEAGTDLSGEYSEYNLQSHPEMATQFLSFLNTGKLFNDINLRKAFSYAIDREKILDFVLNGEGFAPGYHGITPPTFDNYDIDQIKGFTLNVDSARYYLAKAGYPNGNGFPKLVLDLNAGGERNTNVAIEVQKQLDNNLNIEIELNIVPWAQHNENIMSGKSEFFRIGWVADLPRPENFLWLFYGKQVPKSLEDKSYPNFARYISDEFDELYEAALNANSIEEANEYFMQAEKVMIKDAPVIILWYDEGYRMLQSYVRNFPDNPMEFRDFSEVFFEYPKEAKETGA
ncbi:MAG: ABC transporter substrate-binding protein [Cytophagales bacterium]|nr:ABC transporter substrate-binding protein [Cytophagales bacterium]